MDVVPLTADSPDEHLDGWATLLRALYDEQVPELEPPTRAWAVANLAVDDEKDVLALLALSDGEPAGALVTHLPVHEDLDRADALLFVAAAARSGGLARRLLDRGAGLLLERGRQVLRGDAEAGTAGLRWATDLGARETQRVVRSRLDLRTLRTDDLARLARREVPGYRVVTWSDRCPDGLVTEYARARAAMNDAPQGAAERDPWAWDAARVRRWEARHARRGDRCLVTAAVHDETGVVAGFTEIAASGRQPRGVEQEDTAVVADHRGHGLGLLIKAVNLRRLLDTTPHTRWVVTWNAAENRFMRAVNERLGFVPCAEEVELELPLGEQFRPLRSPAGAAASDRAASPSRP